MITIEHNILKKYLKIKKTDQKKNNFKPNDKIRFKKWSTGSYLQFKKKTKEHYKFDIHCTDEELKELVYWEARRDPLGSMYFWMIDSSKLKKEFYPDGFGYKLEYHFKPEFWEKI